MGACLSRSGTNLFDQKIRFKKTVFDNQKNAEYQNYNTSTNSIPQGDVTTDHVSLWYTVGATVAKTAWATWLMLSTRLLSKARNNLKNPHLTKKSWSQCYERAEQNALLLLINRQVSDLVEGRGRGNTLLFSRELSFCLSPYTLSLPHPSAGFFFFFFFSVIPVFPPLPGDRDQGKQCLFLFWTCNGRCFLCAVHFCRNNRMRWLAEQKKFKTKL